MINNDIRLRNGNCPVYFATGHTDLRKGIDGLISFITIDLIILLQKDAKG